MADRWIGLCGGEFQNTLKAIVRQLDDKAILTFAQSPADLRHRIQASPFGLGAVIGVTSDGVSALNVAAAIVKDGMAADVVLVVRESNDEVVDKAQRAGIYTVIDARSVGKPSLADLDEPHLNEDDVPTMVAGVLSSAECQPSRIVQPSKTDGYANRLRGLDFEDDEDEEPGTQILSFPTFAANYARKTSGKQGARHDLELPEQVEASYESDVTLVGEAMPVVSANRNESKGPILTFVSGRGGVGKTSVVTIMALIAASWHMKVALCDLDLSCGNMHSFFGRGNDADLAQVVDGQTFLEEEVLLLGREVRPGVSLWGPCRRPETAELVYPHTTQLLTALSQNADIVLVDTSTTFTDAVAQAAQQCDRFVITVDDRPGSTAAQARLASLAVRLGVARTRIVRLANRCGPHGKGEPNINRAQVGLETARPLRVLDGGIEVCDCLAEGRAEELLDLGSKFVESSATALATLCNELGCLPQEDAAQQALQAKWDRARWVFGRRREAM